MFHDDEAELVFHVKQGRWGLSTGTGVCLWSSCLLCGHSNGSFDPWGAVRL